MKGIKHQFDKEGSFILDPLIKLSSDLSCSPFSSEILVLWSGLSLWFSCSIDLMLMTSVVGPKYFWVSIMSCA